MLEILTILNIILIHSLYKHDIKIANRCFENVAQFKYLRMTVTSKFDSEGN
jgi:hypothetical protein